MWLLLNRGVVDVWRTNQLRWSDVGSAVSSCVGTLRKQQHRGCPNPFWEKSNKITRSEVVFTPYNQVKRDSSLSNQHNFTF